MYKSKLQEYCQSKKWNLPEYSTMKEGLHHCPQFKASVIVNGSTFSTPHFCNSSKEAQNLVARIAFDHLTGSLSASSTLVDAPSSRDDQKPKTNQTPQAASSSGVNSPNRDDKKLRDMTHLCKNQLQIYTQKRNLNLPVYVSEREGPPHACRFKSKVMLDGKTYESLESFSTIKDAENAAARVALMSVSSDGIEEEDPGFFKNLLQQFAQKEYSCLPAYCTTWSGASHKPIFVSTVEINEESFTGQEANTKKVAEMNAAKVAYTALRERKMIGHDVNDTPQCSSPKFQSAELPDISIPGSKLGPNKVSIEQVRCKQGHVDFSNDLDEVIYRPEGQPTIKNPYLTGVHQKSTEFKHTVVKPEVSTNFDENIHGLMEGFPFRQEPLYTPSAPFQPPSKSGLSVINEPSTSSAASSSHKRIKVYPWTSDMTLPPGTTVMHKDEKWVAVTMDPVPGDQ